MVVFSPEIVTKEKKKSVTHRLFSANKCVLFGEDDSLTMMLTDFIVSEEMPCFKCKKS